MTQQTCFIYALMAAKWSSLIPWMSSNSSQIVTAWLFCVFTIIYSLACLVCFCILDEKVRFKFLYNFICLYNFQADFKRIFRVSSKKLINLFF